MGHAFERRLVNRSGACLSPLTRTSNTSEILSGRKIAVVALSTPQWPLIRLHTDKIAAAVNAATPGSYVEVQISVEELMGLAVRRAASRIMLTASQSLLGVSRNSSANCAAGRRRGKLSAVRGALGWRDG
jgi:hypothetical protein